MKCHRCEIEEPDTENLIIEPWESGDATVHHDPYTCIRFLRQRLAELEQEDPERVCNHCGSSRGELVEDLPHGREVEYMHQHGVDCVDALKADKADLQQENQRLRRERDKAVERFGMGVRSYRGQPTQQDPEKCEQMREERAKALEDFAERMKQEAHPSLISPESHVCAMEAKRCAKAIREGRR